MTRSASSQSGQIELSADPGSHGALDLYVPLVDWGVRFEDAIRLPIRLNVDLRTVDRSVVSRVADGGTLSLQTIRSEARDAIAGYLKKLIGLALLGSLAIGLLVAFAVRHRAGPRLRYTVAACLITTVGIGIGARGPLPPARQHRRAQVLRLRPRHPARAGCRRGRAEQHTSARPGARRAARRPRPPGHRPGRPDAAHEPSEHHDRLRPPQQLPRGAGPGKSDRQEPAVLRRRPHRPRLAAGGPDREPGVQPRRPVRVRLRQPRLGQPPDRPRPPRRHRADRRGAADAGRRAMAT